MGKLTLYCILGNKLIKTINGFDLLQQISFTHTQLINQNTSYDSTLSVPDYIQVVEVMLYTTTANTNNDDESTTSASSSCVVGVTTMKKKKKKSNVNMMNGNLFDMHQRIS